MPHPQDQLKLVKRSSEQVAGDSLLLSASWGVPLVKPDIRSQRVLLLASETVFESEARAALENRQRGRESSASFELVCLDFTLCNDFFAVLDLLNYFQRGIFDAIHILPPSSSWSRSRHSDVMGQSPLRSRSAPLGLSSLSPAESKMRAERSQPLRPDYEHG